MPDVPSLLESLAHLATIAGPFLPVAGAITTVSVAGLIPRTGPGRAIWIGLRSRFAFNKTPLSVRKADIAAIHQRISKKSWGNRYLVVTGDKGVGKTCMLDTATNKTAGVIQVDVPAGADDDKIVDGALKALTGIRLTVLGPSSNAKRVIFWYKLFTRTSPLIVMNVSEIRSGDKPASITGAVRRLTERFGLRVIVDSSPNSLDDRLLHSEREDVMAIKPMNREMIWSILELQPLFDAIKEADLADVVWGVLGGNPAKYEKLWGKVESSCKDEHRQLIGDFLCNAIFKAIGIVQDAATLSPVKEIVALFDPTKGYIVREILKQKGLKQPVPDKVFRAVKLEGKLVLVPASKAIGLVLRHKLETEPSLDKLIKMTQG